MRFFRWSHPLYLANGVVGVRERWGPEDANAWRALHAASDKPSSQIYLRVRPLMAQIPSGRPPSSSPMQRTRARSSTDTKDHGSDFIKAYSKLPRGLYFAIAEAARERGIPFSRARSVLCDRRRSTRARDASNISWALRSEPDIV